MFKQYALYVIILGGFCDRWEDPGVYVNYATLRPPKLAIEDLPIIDGRVEEEKIRAGMFSVKSIQMISISLWQIPLAM